MSFDTYFRASSYATIAVAALALTLAGGLQLTLATIFVMVMIVAWRIEGRRWQISERLGLVLVLLAVPLFFVDWQYQKATGESTAKLGVTALAHLIVFLSAIKLLQVKSDRDWVFLYLIAFFEVLLAAGLSFSPVFLITLSLYLLCALSTVVSFEIRKARRTVKLASTRLLVPPDSRIFKRLAQKSSRRNLEARRLPLVAVSLLVLIFVLALPLFLVAPRAGSATIARGGAGLSNFIGFSETVSLGAIGELKRNNEVVMRVRIEDSEAQAEHQFRWRGVGLDEFNGRTWRKSALGRRVEQKTSERGFFQLGTTEALHRLTTQTVFLEPIDSAVLFAASRAVAVQGDFPFVRLDGEGSIQSRHHDFDRLLYKVFSDVTEPSPEALRRDMRPYSAAFERYLQLPEELDPRIVTLATAMLQKARARNRYDAAKAIEAQLQNDYGYTLEMRATGSDPLADFLFNVRAGHCEYFSTAMAVMLRTQGVAARVVNGFLPGEYNEAAAAYTVRQSDAHSWVEVYFPETDSWVTFDPTPAAGKTEPLTTGFAAHIGKYFEALELMWFQYVVGYDKQEQRALATSLQNQMFRYHHLLTAGLNWVKGISWREPLLILAVIALTAFAWFLFARLRRLGWRGLTRTRKEVESNVSPIEFYEELLRLLAARGIERPADQTPLEFASATAAKEVLLITQNYNRVRFGGQRLSPPERREINDALNSLRERLQPGVT